MVLIAAWPAHAAIAVAQPAMECRAEAATTCTTSGVTTTSGNLFVASIGDCCAAFTSVTDSKLNSYGSAIAEQTAADASRTRQLYIAGGVGGASHTFTLTGASALYYGTMSVLEVSGAAASPLDQIAVDSDAAATSHATPATPATSQANELLIGYGSNGIGTTTFTTDTGAGWTEWTNITTDTDTEGLIVGSRVVSAIGTYAYTYTTDISVATSQGISTWKEATSGTRQRCIGCGTDKKVIGE